MHVHQVLIIVRRCTLFVCCNMILANITFILERELLWLDLKTVAVLGV